MGKMKDLVIDQMNNDRNGPDDTDWNAPTYDGAGYTESDRLAPPPDEINLESGLSMWKIKSIKDDCVYKIWAETYEQALELLPRIESF